MRRPVLTRTLSVVLAAALAVTGCASSGTSSARPDATGPAPSFTSQVGDGGATSAGPAPGGTSTASSGGGDGGTGRTGGQPAPKPSTAAPTASGPTIVYFRVRQKPSCPAGTNVNPVPGSPVVLEWKVTNVDNVALSVDGPGIYADNYPPTGTETLNFPCSGGEGDVQRHTYLLTVTNASGKRTKTIEVNATVHEVGSV